MKTIIPEAALEQHVAVLGKTGSGKTYAAKAVIAEPLLAAGRPVGMIDPTGVWWGIRSSRDGKGPGFKVLVLGGDHGDLPLPALGGAAVARLLAEQGVSLIADTSLLTVGERTRWMVDFAGTLYRANRAPLYLILDEAHMFAPQGKIPDPDTGKMLHAVNTLASGGRARGIRLTMLTQRPAKLHKDTLTCADTLIAMRALAPHDRQAVRDWIDGCGDADKGREVLGSLAGLQRGEGWVWYPEGGHLIRAKFPAIRTFDSSATPTAGHALPTPKGAAAIDLTEIKAALADAVKEAEENDPKLLRAEIRRFRAGSQTLALQLAKRPDEASPEALAQAEMRGRMAGRDEVLNWVHTVPALLKSATEPLQQVALLIRQAEEKFQMMALPPLDTVERSPVSKPAPVKHFDQFAIRSKSEVSRGAPHIGPFITNGSMPKSERLVLTALAQYPKGRSKTQIAILTGYAVNGGGFANALGALRSAGRIEGDSGNLTITPTGIAALGEYEPLPRGRALLDYWYRQLGKAERKVLEALAEVYPRTLTKAQIAARAGYAPDGGGFANAMSRLRTLELLKGRAEMKASEDLFE